MKILHKPRQFNSIKIAKGKVEKSSINSEKIAQEYNWYKRVPLLMCKYIPEVYQELYDGPTSRYFMQHIKDENVATAYLSGKWELNEWEAFFNAINEYLLESKLFKTNFYSSSFIDIYSSKTKERLLLLSNSSRYWQELLSAEKININDETYHNFSYFEEQVNKDIVEKLINPENIAFLHGDLCLSNIFFNTEEERLTVIDPRGKWGDYDIYGDINYDLAKLSHSILYGYEFITNDKFNLSEENVFEFSMSLPFREYHKNVQEIFLRSLINNRWEINLITALLFLSMIPLHNEDIKRQKAMYLTSILILNKLYE